MDTQHQDSKNKIALEHFSLEDIQRNLVALRAREQQLIQQEKSGVVSQIKQDIEKYDISAIELGFGLEKRGLKKQDDGSKPVAKFRDNETGKEWSGRGRKPDWLKGKDEAEYLV